MAVILKLLLQLLLALPTLLPLLEKIWDAITGQEGVERRALLKDFKGILAKHKKTGFSNPDAVEKDLMAFHDHLSQKYS